MPQPLPPNPFPAGVPAHQAYATCLTLETSFPLIDWLGPPTLVCARLLGYLLIHAPTAAGRGDVANEIKSCNTDGEKLHKLAQFYINHFIRVFKQDKDRTPVPSGHVSRPPFDDMEETLNSWAAEPPKDHTDAKNRALVRDGYRCVITGSVDLSTFREYPNQFSASDAAHVRVTNCAHILSPSTSQGISGDKAYGPKHEDTASAWALMCRIGGILPVDELSGTNGHRLENVMTMEAGVLALFDELGLWLEATEQPNQYKLCSEHPLILVGFPPTATFTTQSNLPLPNPRYLALHAACAKVAHLSGAGEDIDSVYRAIGATRVLAQDGSSARLLGEAIARTSTTI